MSAVGRSTLAAWAVVSLTAVVAVADALDPPPSRVARTAPQPRVSAPAPEPPAPVAFAQGADEVLAATIVPTLPSPRPPFSAREIFDGPREHRRVALTFDDGPSEFTPRIVRTLDAVGVRATFFVLGPRAHKHPDVLAALDASGHEIANHGWSHRSMRSLWPSQIRAELERTDAVVSGVTGKSPAFVRPPYGRYPESALDVFSQLGKHAILWTVDSEDWRADPQAIARTVVADVYPGAIVLLHDSQRATADALPEIVQGLRGRGYAIVPVSELVGEAAYR